VEVEVQIATRWLDLGGLSTPSLRMQSKMVRGWAFWAVERARGRVGEARREAEAHGSRV
jgi:hypothetical protein